MNTDNQLEFKTSYFHDLSEPDQKTAVAAENKDRSIQIGVWECGPGILELTFPWSESIFVIDGFAEATNLQTNEVIELTKGTMALFEQGTRWSWRIPWKIKKVFTIVDLN